MTAPLRGRDVLTAQEIRRQLLDLNASYDGPGEVAICQRPYATDLRGRPIYSVTYAGEFGVVTLPGDDAAFPVATFVAALLCAEVLDSDAKPGRRSGQ